MKLFSRDSTDGFLAAQTPETPKPPQTPCQASSCRDKDKSSWPCQLRSDNQPVHCPGTKSYASSWGKALNSENKCQKGRYAELNRSIRLPGGWWSVTLPFYHTVLLI